MAVVNDALTQEHPSRPFVSSRHLALAEFSRVACGAFHRYCRTSPHSSGSSMRLPLLQVRRPWSIMLAIGLATATACVSATRSGAHPESEASQTTPVPRMPVLGAPAGVTAIVGATVIDGTGAPPLLNATVVWRGKRIERVGPARRVKVPPEAAVIDGQGLFLLPGFIDVNVHLFFNDTARDPLAQVAIVAGRAQEALRYGVTTLRDTHGRFQPLRAVRDSIRAGKLLAARLLIAGSIIGWDEMNADSLGVGDELTTMSADSLRSRIRQYLDLGVDFIKYGATEHAGSNTLFSEQAQRIIVEEVHKRGLIAETHAIGPEGLRMAVRAGVDLVQHPEELHEQRGGTQENEYGQRDILYPNDLVQLFVQRQVICAFNIVADLPQSRADFHRYENVKSLVRAGCPVAIATDNTYLPGRAGTQHSYYDEGPKSWGAGVQLRAIQTLVRRVGMTPMEAIVAATRNGARASGMLDQLGTVESGKMADLVLWRADPLRDLCHLTEQNIAMVFKEGVLAVSAPSPPPEPCVAKGFYRMVMEATFWGVERLKGQISLTQAQSEAAYDVDVAYRAQRDTMIDSLYQLQDPFVDVRGTGWQRVLGLIERYTGAWRVILTPEQRATFDPRASAWLKELAEDGYPAAGVTSEP